MHLFTSLFVRSLILSFVTFFDCSFIHFFVFSFDFEQENWPKGKQAHNCGNSFWDVDPCPQSVVKPANVFLSALHECCRNTGMFLSSQFHCSSNNIGGGGVILRPVNWCQTMHLLCQTLCDSVSAPPVLSGLMPARSCMKLQTAPAQSMYSTEILGDSLSRQIKACYLTLLQYQLLHC